jgi:hypothetical protein
MAFELLGPMPPANGITAEAEQTTGLVASTKTIELNRPAAHVAVYWLGNPNAHVTLAFSSDGTSFSPPIDAGRDDAGKEVRNGMTYGAVHAAGGAIAVRVITDVPLLHFTVVGIPATEDGATRLVSAGEEFPATDPPEDPATDPATGGPVTPRPAAGDEQPAIISRAQWGADPALLSWAPRFQPPTKVILHHTADGSMPDGSRESYAKLVRAIYHYHAITQDWGDIAYNYLIDPLGNIYEGRYSDNVDASLIGEDIYGNGVVGGHCYGSNTGTIGIAMLGTYRDYDISSAARASLERLLAWLAKEHGIDPLGSSLYRNPFNTSSTVQTWNIAGHLDYRPTDCPGAAFYKTLPGIRQDVFNLAGPVTTPTPSPTYIDLDVSDSSTVVGQQVTVTASLFEEASRRPLPGRPIVFALGGVATAAVPLETVLTDANGVATLKLTCTTAQLLWVTSIFDPGADATYRGSTTCSELDTALAGLVAVAGNTQIRLSWQADPAAAGYNVYRDGKKLNSAPVPSATYLDTGLANNTQHSYQVTAIVDGRESRKSATVTASASASAGTPAGPAADDPVDDPGNVSGDSPADTPLFPDVISSHRYFSAVQDLGRNGIINGAPGGLFLPGEPVTRQQFAKMIVLSGGYPVSEEDVCKFKDVDNGGGATLYPDNYVAVCAARGMTRGKTTTMFDPYAMITRAQVLTMVVRAAKDFKPSAIQEPPSGWKGVLRANDPTHRANVARAEYSGLLSGIDLSSFSVSGNASRGEIAQIIWNLLRK